MPVDKQEWTRLAGPFPASLVTNRPEEQLKPNETPNATGLSVTDEGYLVKGTQPAGTARTVKTYADVVTPDGLVTPAAKATYEWHYKRLWRLDTSTAILHYGAPRYTNAYYRQGAGQIDFNEDGTTKFLKMLPIGESGLILLKTTGAYIIPNAAGLDGNFSATDFKQEIKIAGATHAVELDGTVYIVNATGVFAINGNGNTEEISYPLRGDLPAVGALTVDYEKKLLNIAATHTYDVNNKRWFKYSGSTFVYETRRISGNGKPGSVDRIGFEFDRTNTADAEMRINFKYDDREWEDSDIKVLMPHQRGTEAWVQVSAGRGTGTSFKLKITSMPTNIKIKGIWVSQTIYTEESRHS